MRRKGETGNGVRGVEGLQDVEQRGARAVQNVEQRLAEGEGDRVVGSRVVGEGVVVEGDRQLHYGSWKRRTETLLVGELEHAAHGFEAELTAVVGLGIHAIAQRKKAKKIPLEGLAECRAGEDVLVERRHHARVLGTRDNRGGSWKLFESEEGNEFEEKSEAVVRGVVAVEPAEEAGSEPGGV